jgi:fused signal recognition particle receptor
MGIFSFFSKKENKEKLDQGLEKTKKNLFSNIAKAIVGKSKVDELVLDDLEEALISSDVGIDTTIKIIENIEERVSRDKYFGSEELNSILKEEIYNLIINNDYEELLDFSIPKNVRPYVIMVVGVNGVGKTTTIGKLAKRFKDNGFSVMLGAADTFRAAAIEQLMTWGERANVPVITQKMGSDPAAVCYDTLESAMAKNTDIVIIDTAGRLHNKKHLMEELTKVKRVMRKVVDDAPHDVMLVLDASTGQNAIMQAKEFTSATEVSSIALTKLDGTAKGGVVIGISDQFKIPIKYMGVGEKVEDLQIFNKKEFVDSLFKNI